VLELVQFMALVLEIRHLAQSTAGAQAVREADGLRFAELVGEIDAAEAVEIEVA